MKLPSYSPAFLLLVFLATMGRTTTGQVIQTVPIAEETDWHQRGFWQTTDGELPGEGWEFVDGEVRLVKPRSGKGNLVSPPLPASFDLRWQWKIERGTNTGLKYRVRPFGSRWLGLEYQIIDEPISGDSVSQGSTASIYDLVAPSSQRTLRPAGQWNDSRVVASGHRIEHYLNDELVASTFTAGPIWDQQIALSKFFAAEGFGQPGEQDRVMLTDHGGKTAYRNFRFVALNPVDEDSELPKSSPPFLANAMRNSWADQNSIVLWTRTTAHREMNRDGQPFNTLPRAELSELSKSGDAQAMLQAQLPAGATLDDMLGACPGAAGEVRLTYFPKLQRKSVQVTDWKTTHAEHDFTAQWRLEGLKPDTEYAAVIEARPVGRQSLSAIIRGGFRTAPRPSQSKNIKFCVTTCHDFIRRDDGLNGHKIYPTMTEIDPDFVVHAGDIEYYDKPRPFALTVELMRFKWGRIFSLPSNRRFYQQTTSYFLKDDHDTLKNDCWAGQTYGVVSFERGVQIFNEEQFPTQTPRYKTVRWGRDLQVWFLEGRDYRSPNRMPDGPDKTILGAEQKAWLFRTLEESDARFKLIFSPTPVVGPDRVNKSDNHANANFVFEGNEIRDQFARHPGVIVFCGDRHWQYASVDEQTGLWEFGCGPGSEEHELGWKKGDQRPSHRFLRVAGGFLSGRLQYDDDDQPQLTVRHHQVTGEQVSEFSFPQ